jgi:Tfp pilus assembly protein PilN
LTRNEVLKEQYAKRRRFIERSGLLQSSRFSYFFDRIARIVPDSLELTSLSIATTDDKIRLGKPIKYNENQILVSGSSKGSNPFNNWKDKLKREVWLKDIFIIKFGQEEPNKPIYFELLLEINR